MTEAQKAQMRRDIKNLRIVMNGTKADIRKLYGWNK